MTLLHAQQLTIQIGDKRVCHQLELEMQAGQVWGVMGRNGTGKTTLLHTLAGLRPVDAGEIFLAQNSLLQLSRKQIAQKIGLLLQHHEDPFPATVLETVVTGRHPHIGQWQWESETDYQLAGQALQRIDMAHMAQRQVSQLSGGERQRVAIATLLTQDPAIFLLDEPNSHLDLNYQIKLLNYLCDYAQQNQRLVIMTLHDINLAARYCDHLLFLLDDGEHLSGSRQEMLHESNLERMFCHPVRQYSIGQQTIFIPD